MNTDYTAVFGLLMGGNAYRVRWAKDECWLEMSRISPEGVISEDWAPVPSSEDADAVLEAIHQAREAVAEMSKTWHH